MNMEEIMKERIVQLSNTEYNKLIEFAKMSSEEIEKRAKEMYQEKGTYGIKLELNTGQSYVDEISFKASSYVIDWGGQFPISDEDKRKIVKFVNNRALRMMQEKFGKQINDRNCYAREARKASKLYHTLMRPVFIAWLTLLLLQIIILFK